MTLRNKQAYMDSLWDWGIFDKCFTDKIKVSDVDGMVERHQHVLFLEAKPPGKNISYGQQLAFESLAKCGYTVLVLWGNPSTPQEMQFWFPHKTKTKTRRITTDLNGAQEFVRRWFVWANHMPLKSTMDKWEKWPVTLDLTGIDASP